MPRIPVITRCRLQTADRIQNVDKVQSVDCRLQSGYKVQTENLKSFFVWYVIKSSCNLPSVTQSLFRDQLSRLFGSYENEDPENDDLRRPYENEDALRKRRPPTKTKPITKTKTPLRKRRPITKTKTHNITFVDKDYVHETHYENEDPYGNLEFWIWHVCNLLRNISTVEPHGAFNRTNVVRIIIFLSGICLFCWQNADRDQNCSFDMIYFRC